MNISKKYLIVFMPLFLCALMISIRPTIIRAQDKCTDDTGMVVSCDDPSAINQVQANPGSSPAADTSANPNPPAAGANSANPTGLSSGTDVNKGLTGTDQNKGTTGTDINSGGQTQSGGFFYLQNPLCQGSTTSFGCTVGGIISGFLSVLSYLAVLLAVLAIIWVGLQFVLARGNSERMKELKEQLMWIVIGVAIVIGARIIVNVVINTLEATGTINSNVIQSAHSALNVN